MNEILENGLAKLEMVGSTIEATGLVSVSKIENKALSKLPPEEIIALENAAVYQADYVYFRRFSNRPSVAQVYIYDYTQKQNIDEDSLVILHKKLYSSGNVPMFFVFTRSEVIIFNCLEKPALGNKLIYKPLTTIQIASNSSKLIDESINFDKLKSFSGKSFDNGFFWDNPKYSQYFKSNNSAYEKLLNELKKALHDVIDKGILPANIARKLMVISILIKYLEDRVDTQGNSVFPDAFFKNFSQEAESYTDVLENSHATLLLFDYLGQHFNGGIFKIDPGEREQIRSINLTRFSHFLRGDLDGMQFLFWKLYSFNDLPVELISNIYEEFLGKQPGVVYTPPYLVNFLLDEVLPLSDNKTDIKILDPACGSGVFLVGAYRRLIQRWRIKNNWETPSLSILKQLLTDNIYGVDKDTDATNLTIFSLSLALCDELTPKQIWEELHFDNLKDRNIFNDDFFEVLSTNSLPKEGFDLVIGNPPFDSKLTNKALEVEKAEKRNRIVVTHNNRSNTIPVPDNQIALLFLEQSVRICKEDGLVCLIQPSGPLLYNRSSFDFRKYLFTQYHIPQVIDFTHISRTLFGEKGDVATAAIFIKNQPPLERGVLHATVRRTKVNKEKLYLELDSYDFHYIPRHLALNDHYIWKANFLGGHRYHQLISRLSEHRTLGSYLKTQIDENGWAVSEGFTLATSVDRQKIRTAIESGGNEIADALIKRLSAPFLTGKRFLPTNALDNRGIDWGRISILEHDLFHSTGDEFAYKGPHILLKEVLSDNSITAVLLDEDLGFQNSIVGIHAPNEHYEELQILAESLSQSKVYPFYIAGTSGRYLVNKSSSVLKKDFDNLPYPEDLSDLDLSPYEQILIDDFSKFMLDFRKAGETSEVALRSPTKEELTLFGEVFCEVLNSVFHSLKTDEYFETESYICYPFYFGDKPYIEFDANEDMEKHISFLIEREHGTSLRIIRVIRIYDNNIIFLIKPKKLRYWLRSVALRDADETFSDLRKQGY